jgi:hypothetical protein
MDRDDAIALIRSSGLADRLDRILPHLAPGMRIRTTRAPAAAKALVSRFAGSGVLPRGTPWPVWDSSAFHRRWIEYSRASMVNNKGSSQRFWTEQIERYEAAVRDNPKPLHFLAMLRIADFRNQAAQLGLPERGALLFFYDVERCQGSFWPEARGGWQVLYAQDEGDLVLIEDPPVHVPEFLPSTLAFEMQYSLPEDIRTDTGDGDLRVYENAEYERVHGALLGSSRTDQVIHQLCGAPQEVQNGLFLQCQLASNGLDCGNPQDYRQPRVRELESGAKDWRLLLQIDSDDDGPGWMWGDVGRLYYCMHRDDLAARRFDRSCCSEQCG